MTTIPTPKGNLMLVEVPQEAENIELYPARIEWVTKVGFDTRGITLAEQYELLGTIENGVPDFDVSGYVEIKKPEWKDYDTLFNKGVPNKTKYHYLNKDLEKWRTEIKDSFLSLLESHKIQLDKKYVCLKIKE